MKKACVRSAFVFISLLVTGIPGLLLAQEWPQWRGPDRDGHARSFSSPETWPDELKTVWSVGVGAGLSSPVLKDDKIFLITREGNHEVVMSLSLKDGSVLWKKDYESVFIPNAQATSGRLFPESRGKGPFATPVVHGNRLYTLGVDRVFSSYDASSGALQWRKQPYKMNVPGTLHYECPPCGCNVDGQVFDAPGTCSACRMEYGVKDVETSATLNGPNYYGAAASPIVFGETVIIHVGNAHSGKMIAMDLKSGQARWAWEGPAMSSSSPVLAEIHGVHQLITLTRTSCVGVGAKDGKLLWSFDLESNAQIVTPTVYEDLVIFSAYRSPTTAIRIGKQDRSWTTAPAWENKEITLYTSSPIRAGHQLFGFSYSKLGQYFGLDIRTGETLWTSEGRLGAGAAIVDLGEVLAALTNFGKLTIMAKSDSYQKIKEYTLSESPTWAHPIFWDKSILIRDESNLTLLSL